MIWVILQAWLHTAAYYLLFKICYAEYEINSDWLSFCFSCDCIWQSEKLKIDFIDNAEQLICHVMSDETSESVSNWMMKIKVFQYDVLFQLVEQLWQLENEWFWINMNVTAKKLEIDIVNVNYLIICLQDKWYYVWSWILHWSEEKKKDFVHKKTCVTLKLLEICWSEFTVAETVCDIHVNVLSELL